MLEVATNPDLVGRALPRLAPPWPLHSDGAMLSAQAEAIGITFMPFQDTVAHYLDAVRPDGNWLYPEVLGLIGRQNGKTEILIPHIVRRLRMRRRIMHAAQDRQGIVRDVFTRVAGVFEDYYPNLIKKIRYANGQEAITTIHGGVYRIVASTRSGARGPANDDVIVDECRELQTSDFVGAAEPTLSASPNPQMLYFSNEGDETSVVLNDLKSRADKDPSLAFLEWSAAPERPPDDIQGWLEANPSVGHLPGKLEYLKRKFESYRLAGTLAIWETEHLCRAVPTMRRRLVAEHDWLACRVEALEEPRSPAMAISQDPDGHRAAAAIAWQRPDRSIALRLIYDVTGAPIDQARLGPELRRVADRMGVRRVGYDPMTDAELAKFFARPEPVSGAKFVNATTGFVTAIEGGRLEWVDADAVTDDLVWTSRKDKDRNSYEAVRSADSHPIPAALAAIRAVWLASGPPPGPARIY